MSNEAITAVLRHSHATYGDRLVMLVLANVCDHDGEGFPKIDYLATAARMSKRAVQLAITALVEAGELEIERGVGRGHQSQYRLLLEGLASRKGEKISPFTGTPPGQKVKSATRKGEICDTEKVKNSALLEGTHLKTPLTTPVDTNTLTSRDDTEKMSVDDRWAKRLAIFSAYCDGLGIAPDSPEAKIRQHTCFGHLTDDVTKAIDVSTIADLARFAKASLRASGITAHPRMDTVLSKASEFAQWIADGRPPLGRSSSSLNGRTNELAFPAIAGVDGGDGGYGSWSRQGRRVKP